MEAEFDIYKYGLSEYVYHNVVTHFYGIEVWIFLGGNHRLDWISAYPLPTDPQGVRQALKDYYGLTFDIDAYAAQIIQKNNAIWQIVHYPYCNSVTVTQAC